MTKKHSYIIMLVLFITILSTATQAYTLESVTIKDTLTDAKSLQEQMTFILSNNTKDSLNIILASKAYNIKVNGKDAKPENNSLNLKTTCKDCKIQIDYELNDVVKETSFEVYDFTRTMNLPSNPKEFLYSVKLPIGKIVNLNDNTNIIPNGPQISTDGESIIINWEEKNPDLPKLYHITYKGHENTEELFPEIANEIGEWQVIVLMIICIVLGSFLGWGIKDYYLKNKSQVQEIEAMELPASLFNPDEKTVINKIKENKGQIKQKELGKQLEWSKSKVSAIITNLEYKKVIRREKLGRNYDIFLEKNIKE